MYPETTTQVLQVTEQSQARSPKKMAQVLWVPEQWQAGDSGPEMTPQDL